MSGVIYKGPGGTVVLPKMVFLDRADGGHLIVNPPKHVWEQSELSAVELAHWCFLVGAVGRAMIDVLPQLDGGCVNYFEAGNWALNYAAPPKGPKRAKEHRRVHMHIHHVGGIGRLEDALTGEHLIKDDAETVEVRARVHRMSQALFRAHVPWCR